MRPELPTAVAVDNSASVQPARSIFISWGKSVQINGATSVDDARAKLEARAEPIYHPVWGKDADELTRAPFEQNSGHPPSGTPMLCMKWRK